MDAAQYDAWYDTPRGAWIGEVEYALLHERLAPRAGETLLDVGCGTGYFTRRFAAVSFPGKVVGVDRDAAAVRYAAEKGGAEYLVADACCLPFADKRFDVVASITALCFIADERLALAEMLRVARRRIVLGLLNRHSLLWWQKGRGGGAGAYRGAHWHTAEEAIEMWQGLAAKAGIARTAVVLPGGGALARRLEAPLRCLLPRAGAFLVVAADCPD